MKLSKFEFLRQVLEVLEALPGHSLGRTTDAWLRAWNYNHSAKHCLAEHAEAVADLAAVEAQWSDPQKRWRGVRQWLLNQVPPVPRF